jgi:hypothetical protein
VEAEWPSLSPEVASGASKTLRRRRPVNRGRDAGLAQKSGRKALERNRQDGLAPKPKTEEMTMPKKIKTKLRACSWPSRNYTWLEDWTVYDTATPGLAVHRTIGVDYEKDDRFVPTGTWTITHIESGRSIGSDTLRFDRRRDAYYDEGDDPTADDFRDYVQQATDYSEPWRPFSRNTRTELLKDDLLQDETVREVLEWKFE